MLETARASGNVRDKVEQIKFGNSTNKVPLNVKLGDTGDVLRQFPDGLAREEGWLRLSWRERGIMTGVNE
jgi:hypothetical protein